MISSPDDVTNAVLAVMERTKDDRLRAVLRSLVTHLHGFIRETKLTEAEFRAATALIAELGQRTNETHNEVVLMAGSLGVSSLVCLQNNGDAGSRETSQSLLGPFWRLHSPFAKNGDTIVRSDTPGDPLVVRGTVLDQNGNAVVGAEVDIWHASPHGTYENQDENQADFNLRGKFTTDDAGQFWFRTVKMVGYPIPTDGVVGRLLAAQSRHPYRPAHLHALIVKEGFKVLISQVYDSADPLVDDDVQFGVTRSLLGEFIRHEGPNPDYPDITGPWFSLDYTYHMESGEAVLPRPPIK